MGKLDNKVALITGAGSGMGQASACLFAREGAKVVAADIDVNKGEETVKLIKEAGGEAISVEADVTKMADMEKMVKTTVDTYGKLNVLFNHAGMPGPFMLEEVSEDEYRTCLDVNTKGSFFITKLAVPEIRKAGGGSIIFTASTAGLMGARFSPTYSLAKGGLVVFAKGLALLLAPDNIRVNCICPGLIDTPMALGFMGPGTQEKKENTRDMFVQRIPMGRMGRPEEIANTALFLASDEASYITGVALPVDGGLVAG